MKCLALAVLVGAALLPAKAPAQEIRTLAIGHITQVADRAPTTWGMSGMEIIRLAATVGSVTPITRSLAFDARTVEILSRTQAPPIRPSDVRVISRNGRNYIVVRRFMLLEVMPEDARAEGTNAGSLARKWAASVRRVLPQVAPTPNRFGV